MKGLSLTNAFPVPRLRSCPTWGWRTTGDDVAPGRHELLVELELPEVPGERQPRTVAAHVRVDRLAPRHADDELGVGVPVERRVHRRREGPAEARVDVGDAQPDLAVAEGLDGARAPHAESLDH